MSTSTYIGPDPREVRRFLVLAAKLLHRHGTPAHRIEDTLVACATGLGQRLQVFATPTSIEMAFGSGRRQRPYLIRSDSGEAELGRLVELDRVITRVREHELEPRAGRRALARIAAAPPRFGPVTVTFAFALASAGAARFFAGNLAELTISFALGLLIGLLALAAGRRVGLGRVFAPLAAFVAAGVSLACERALPGVHASVTTLAALIVLVPGLSLTVALTELATRHLVSGTARLAGSLTVFAIIAVGVALARELLTAMPEFGLPFGALPALWLAPLPEWTRVLALVLAPLGFCVLFQARLADLPAIAVTGIVGSEATRLVALAASPELGAFAGAFVVGLAANAYAARRRLPAAVVLLPGLILLVPGSLGFQSLSSFLAHDALTGVEVGFRMVLIAVSLVAGVLVANTVALPHLRRPAAEHRAA